jgi:acyl-CoA synthetase (AMP-forming)/AMP-acid ligase II/thioesterase domain-containing protein/acyl carrier protein
MTERAAAGAARTSTRASIVSDDHSIANLLLRAAERFPERGMLLSGQSLNAQFVAYPELLRQAQQILGGLHVCGRARGTVVALLLESPADFIPAFWACVLGGYIPCPLAPIRNDAARWTKHLSHVGAVLDHPLFIGTNDLLEYLPGSVTSAPFEELRDCAPQQRVHPAEASDTAVLMLTSGSTGNSKAVELTHANLLASMTARAQRQQLTDKDIAFNWIAFDHVAALLESHMIALHVGATQLHARPDAVLTDPLSFLRLIHRHRVSLAFAPNFLLAQINTAIAAAGPLVDGADPIDLSCLRRIVTGGEANVVATGRRFLELLAPHGLAHCALWPAFGMTETCAACVYSHDFPERDAGREFAAVGLPLSGLEIRIVDDDGHACPAGTAGELQVRGPMVFHRYRRNEEATRAAFTTDGWFRTGDVGRLDTGWLSLVARNKDSIIVNGVNYFGHELERKLEQLDGVQQSFVAAFPTRPSNADTEQLVVMFAADIPPSEEEALYRLVIAIRNTTIMLWGFRPAAILPLPKDAFPKTSLGKIQRSLLRKRLEAGDFADVLDYTSQLASRFAGAHTVPDGPVEHAVAQIFAEILAVKVDTLSTTASFFDLGGTSMDIMRLTRALERSCGFQGGLPIILQNPSIRQLASRIAARGRPDAQAYEPIVCLQSTGRKAPLFCVHPGNGEIFSLVNVAKYFLNDRPFYALRAPGFNEGEKYFETFAELLSTYVDAILKRQAHGPYAIAGYSFGCVIAFEIAKELEARGLEVAFLGSIDGLPRPEASPMDINMAAGLAWVTDLIPTEVFNQLNKELGPNMPTREVGAYVLKFASPQRLAELNLDLEKFTTWARVAHGMERVLYLHQNSGRVRSMTIFRGEGYLPRFLPHWSSTETWRKVLTGWDAFVERTRYIDVPGHHFIVMGPQNVAGFQAVLRAEIDRSFQESA